MARLVTLGRHRGPSALLRRRTAYTGKRVRLVEMVGETAVPTGTEGTVTTVDDGGTLHVSWDNGRNLILVPGDTFRVLA